MEEKIITKATSGQTATISYETTFADATKKTVTIGSFRNQDLPSASLLKTNIAAVNVSIGSGNLNDFSQNYLSSSGAYAQAITGCTITVKSVDVLVDNYYGA